MNHICPHCGAPLHDDSSFCPHCAVGVNQRTQLRPPSALPRRIRYLLIILAVSAAAAAGIFFFLQPDIYEGAAEVTYRDSDGTYQILLGKSSDRYTPVPEINSNAERGAEYRFPVCLFINHEESGANAKEVFLKKVESITTAIEPAAGSSAADGTSRADGSESSGGSESSAGSSSGPADDADSQGSADSSTLTCTEPAPHDFCTDAAMVSFVDYIGQEQQAKAVWTLHMKNGDEIRLHQTIRIHLIRTYDYYPETTPMSTTEELQTLLDEIAETTEMPDVVNIHLPPVTYEGGLSLEKRPVNLFGSTGGGRRTTFTDTVRVINTDSNISYIQDIDFAGSDDSVGISASSRLHITGCRFFGWKTGVLGYGYSWVNIQDSRFESNRTGFHFNSTGGIVTHTQFTGNEFINNETAVLLESVPTDVTMTFAGCSFAGNTTDIDNRCDQDIDISEAVFQ